jgi:L-aspartate oxidase
VAVALGPDDDAGLHLDDTLSAGAGIVSRPAAEVLVQEGPERIRELAAWGARFDREHGHFHFTREGAHSRNRVLHALGDATGWEMVRTLLDKARRTPNVSVRSYACSTDLVLHEGRVAGCRFLPEGGGEGQEQVQVLARATLLATGGAGQVFLETTNPPVATGDGMAMALRAGAALLDAEFVQFHPTALAIPGAPRFLLSEALRGEGAWLINAAGERFVDELRPRDQVARAIVAEDAAGKGPVRLDVRHLDGERVRTRFPRIHATCLRYGVDITREAVPVTPAAHYVMGGVATDLSGRSTLPGLYAAGEVAGTGVHGANRLASNSLLEGLVYGARAAEAILADAPAEPPAVPAAPGPEEPGRGDAESAAAAERVRHEAWRALGLSRDAVSLRGLLAGLGPLRDQAGTPCTRAAAEARNLADVAGAMARCALFREESRGGHYRADFPHPDERRFHGHTLLRGDDVRLADVDRPLEHAGAGPAAGVDARQEEGARR